MSVKVESIIVGAVFRFKTALRRVIAVGPLLGTGFNVVWAYADGEPRGGKLGGKQWVHYFKKEAIEQVFDAPPGKPVMLAQDGTVVTAPATVAHLAQQSQAGAQGWVLVSWATGDLYEPQGEGLVPAGEAASQRILELFGGPVKIDS